MAVLRHPVHNHPIVELRGSQGAWATTAKKHVGVPSKRWLGGLAAIPLRSGGAILVLKMVNCKKSVILQEKIGIEGAKQMYFFLMISIKMTGSS